MNLEFSEKIKESLYKSLPIFEKMLEDRKYIPLSNKCIKLDIIERMNERKYETPSGKLALVIIASCTGDIKIYNKYICSDNYETIVCVYTNTINKTHRKMEKFFNCKIEIWNLITIYIADHELQPKIEIVNNLDIFKIDQIQISKLPKISFYDPLMRYYKIPYKSIIKIYEKTGLISYRIVI